MAISQKLIKAHFLQITTLTHQSHLRLVAGDTRLITIMSEVLIHELFKRGRGPELQIVVLLMLNANEETRPCQMDGKDEPGPKKLITGKGWLEIFSMFM